MRQLSIIIIIFSIQLTILQAQTTLWQINFTAGDTISNVSLNELKGDSLAIVHDGSIKWIQLKSIIEMRNNKESSFWDGAKTGAKIGSISGAVLSAIFAKPGGSVASDPGVYRIVAAIGGGVYLGIIGGLLGGVLGSIAGIDEVIDFTEMNILAKRRYIRHLLSRESKSQ